MDEFIFDSRRSPVFGTGGMAASSQPLATAAALEILSAGGNAADERGHPIRLVSGWERALFGRGQVIQRDPRSGVLCGGSDPRADGCAMTLP